MACTWGLASGFAIGAFMLLGENAVAALLVPDSARSVFAAAWLLLALAQQGRGEADPVDSARRRSASDLHQRRRGLGHREADVHGRLEDPLPQLRQGLGHRAHAVGGEHDRRGKDPGPG